MSELAQVTKEYQFFFQSITFPNTDNPNIAHLQTLENKALIIEFTNSGWLIDGQLFETFENGMMTLSPGFRSKFHQVLNGKLSKLEGDNNNE